MSCLIYKRNEILYLTNPMEHSHNWEAATCSAGQETPCFSSHPKVVCRLRMNPPSDHIITLCVASYLWYTYVKFLLCRRITLSYSLEVVDIWHSFDFSNTIKENNYTQFVTNNVHEIVEELLHWETNKLYERTLVFCSCRRVKCLNVSYCAFLIVAQYIWDSVRDCTDELRLPTSTRCRPSAMFIPDTCSQGQHVRAGRRL
jgi:hypothetical protein